MRIDAYQRRVAELLPGEGDVEERAALALVAKCGAFAEHVQSGGRRADLGVLLGFVLQRVAACATVSGVDLAEACSPNVTFRELQDSFEVPDGATLFDVTLDMTVWVARAAGEVRARSRLRDVGKPVDDWSFALLLSFVMSSLALVANSLDVFLGEVAAENENRIVKGEGR